MKNEESKSLTDIEWEQRTLCSDESCIGVIGPDGRCKECGLPYESEKQQDFSEEHAASDSEAEEEVAEDDEDDEGDEEVAEDDEEDVVTDIEWEQRTLCRDESCIGVIGPDGRCKECGLPYENQ
jgi:predicted Zn-ribbon and HTH transcriptional regulator